MNEKINHYTSIQASPSENFKNKNKRIKFRRRRLFTLDEVNWHKIDSKIKWEINSNSKKSTNNEVNKSIKDIDMNYKFDLDSAHIKVSNNPYNKSEVSSPNAIKIENKLEDSESKSNSIIEEALSNISEMKKINKNSESKRHNVKRRKSYWPIVSPIDSMRKILNGLREIEEKMDLA